MFEDMVERIHSETASMLLKVEVTKREDGGTQMNKSVSVQKTSARSFDKVGRNDPCPCGSGKKYKNCCMVGK